jgi:hypothetical protein
MHKPHTRDAKQREAFRLANDLMTDLVTGGSAYVVFQSLFERNPAAVPDHVRTAATRLCLFHAIITLSKWVELYDRYRDVIPTDVKELAKHLRKEITDRGIMAFRNKVVGHVWDDDQRRALTNAEVEERVIALAGSDVATFLRWAAEPLSATNTTSPVAIIETVRDSIRQSYGLTDQDLNR